MCRSTVLAFITSFTEVSYVAAGAGIDLLLMGDVWHKCEQDVFQHSMIAFVIRGVGLRFPEHL